MDLSAVIFVVLAVAWAVYLIPKALKHHDEMASDRLVEGHSDKARILSRHGRTATAPIVEEPAEEAADAVAAPVAATAPEPVAAAPAPRPLPTRAAARRAARNRRRVLAGLGAVLVVVAALAFLGYAPTWSIAVPAGLVVAFLVLARFTVRKAGRAGRTSRAQQGGRSAQPAPRRTTTVAERPVTEVHAPAPAESMTARLADEDTTGIARAELEAALADDGSLWDPLPMTLPTYVNKARARRTVRTIELTGINSSGHDESASALARESEESRAAETPAPRKAAGAWARRSPGRRPDPPGLAAARFGTTRARW